MSEREHSMRVLGIDPGYAIVGWGVVEYAGNRFAPVDFGAVCTDAGVPFERRLDEVYTGAAKIKQKVPLFSKKGLHFAKTSVILICVASRRHSMRG